MIQTEARLQVGLKATRTDEEEKLILLYKVGTRNLWQHIVPKH